VGDERLFTIGEVGRTLDIPVTTLRFYEKEFPSLLKPRRTAGGHRRYTQAHVEAFRFIKETSGRIPLREIKAQTPDPASDALEKTVEGLRGALLGLDQRVRKMEEALAGFANRLSVLEEKSRKKWFR
jgi:DNA-binding transcriptional MerR regulator